MHVETCNSDERRVGYAVPKDLDRRVGRVRRIVFAKK
jgi:hypothetical protein